MINKFDRFVVVFRPKRVDDLKPQAALWVGREFEVEALFSIEDGPYAGQWAFEVAKEYMESSGLEWPGWLPECDLTIVGDGNLPSWRKVRVLEANPLTLRTG